MAQKSVVSFSRLQDGTKNDFEILSEAYKDLCSGEKMAERVLSILELQRGVLGGCKVDLYEHGLQTATRAYRDGCDEEMVVCALLHDLGELLTPANHGEVIASILRPYISHKAWWILAHHEVFQGFYYYHHYGGDKDKRDIWKSEPYYEDTMAFCEKYDAPSFDPTYDSIDLDFFRPMVYRIFSRKPYFHTPDHPKAVAVVGSNETKTCS